MAEKKKMLKVFDSQENSFLIEDYPWGFRLRTQQRVWVESKKGFGQRVMRQTLNPKNGKWCKAKASTYYVVLGLYLDENDYVQTWALSSGGWTKEDKIKEFEAFYGDQLTDFQKEQIRYIRATNVVNDIIKVEIVRSEPINLTKVMNGDPEEIAKMKAQEKKGQTEEEKKAILNKALTYGFAVVDGKVPAPDKLDVAANPIENKTIVDHPVYGECIANVDPETGAIEI